MDAKKLEAGQCIAEFAKVFANAIGESMKNSGMMMDGYQLTVFVYPPYKDDDGDITTATVNLEIPENPWDSGFIWHKFAGEGWRKLHEPGIQDVIRPVSAKDGEHGSGKKAEKPLPPDGLWISVYDDYRDVDGGQ